jgi:hypothetical protein
MIKNSEGKTLFQVTVTVDIYADTAAEAETIASTLQVPRGVTRQVDSVDIREVVER